MPGQADPTLFILDIPDHVNGVRGVDGSHWQRNPDRDAWGTNDEWLPLSRGHEPQARSDLLDWLAPLTES